MEETSEKNKTTTTVGREPFLLQINPCKYFQEFIRTVFKCLGFESTPDIQRSSSKGKDNSKFTVDGTAKEVSSSPAVDFPPSTADPPADPSELAMLTIGRTPPTPTIGGGRGAQNN
ncbi:hypothetical protein OROGR_021309 [Orobanche gracilis]